MALRVNNPKDFVIALQTLIYCGTCNKESNEKMIRALVELKEFIRKSKNESN